MNKVQEALKAAIKAMEMYIEGELCIAEGEELLELCKSALSDIENCEPVAYLCRSKMTDYAISLLPTRIARETEIAKGWSEWHPVDNEKYKFYFNSIGKSDWLSDYEFIPLYTSPQPIEKCEPVGWYCKACKETGLSHCSDPVNCGGMVRTYTSPISKEWVGLSDEEIFALCPYIDHDLLEEAFYRGAKAIEAKLKE